MWRFYKQRRRAHALVHTKEVMFLNEETFFVELGLEGDLVVATLTEVCEEQVDMELAEFELKHPLCEVISRRDTGRKNLVQLFFTSTSDFVLQYDEVPIAAKSVLLKTKGRLFTQLYGLTERETLLFLKKLKRNNEKVNYTIRRK